MIGGVPLFVNAVSPTFDPATLSLDGWYRASYGGEPWEPTVSAGTSGSNGNLVSSTAAPSVGSAVNGYNPAEFVPDNDLVAETAILTDMVSTTAWTVVMLFRATDALAAAAPENDPQLFCADTFVVGMSFSADGVLAYQDPLIGALINTTPIALATGTWALCAARFDGSNIKCRVSKASGTTDATPQTVGVATFIFATALFGQSSIATYLDGEVLEIMLSKTCLSDANLVSIRDYFNARYALSLT